MQPDENDIVFDQYQIDFLGFFRALFEAFDGTDTSGAGTAIFDALVSSISDLWSIFVVISYLLAALLLFGLIYAYIRANQMGDIETQGILNLEKLYSEIHRGENTNNRWLDVEQHSQTDNPNDWKLAIIEADIMLEEMLTEVGYAGATIGEKLKSASPTNFQTLDDAWKAHLVRNKIAHQGADFVLTKKLAQETITQYRRVFQEFGVI